MIYVAVQTSEHFSHSKIGPRPRGSTLCLKVWTLPKGVRVPVRLNTLGEPIGKEAATLSSFVGILARDGILAPITYHNWKLVPDKNKVVMYHIVKVCTNMVSVFCALFCYFTAVLCCSSNLTLLHLMSYGS